MACTTGLAAHFRAKSWRETDSRRAKSDRWKIDELPSRLAEQAEALSSSVTIRALVLDASLDSTTATGIEDQEDTETC
jgi:hypothetical protein